MLAVLVSKRLREILKQWDRFYEIHLFFIDDTYTQ